MWFKHQRATLNICFKLLFCSVFFYFTVLYSPILCHVLIYLRLLCFTIVLVELLLIPHYVCLSVNLHYYNHFLVQPSFYLYTAYPVGLWKTWSLSQKNRGTKKVHPAQNASPVQGSITHTPLHTLQTT